MRWSDVFSRGARWSRQPDPQPDHLQLETGEPWASSISAEQRLHRQQQASRLIC